MMAEKDLLGISGRITAERVDELILDLSNAWAAVFGQPIGELDDDLALVRRWFDPVAQGQRLRREISELTPMPDGLNDPLPPLTVGLGTGKWLVTPEGRCALDLLQQLPKDRSCSSCDFSPVSTL